MESDRGIQGLVQERLSAAWATEPIEKAVAAPSEPCEYKNFSHLRTDHNLWNKLDKIQQQEVEMDGAEPPLEKTQQIEEDIDSNLIVERDKNVMRKQNSDLL